CFGGRPGQRRRPSLVVFIVVYRIASMTEKAPICRIRAAAARRDACSEAVPAPGWRGVERQKYRRHPWPGISKLLIQQGCFAQVYGAARGPPRGDDVSR